MCRHPQSQIDSPTYYSDNQPTHQLWMSCQPDRISRQLDKVSSAEMARMNV